MKIFLGEWVSSGNLNQNLMLLSRSVKIVMERDQNPPHIELVPKKRWWGSCCHQTIMQRASYLFAWNCMASHKNCFLLFQKWKEYYFEALDLTCEMEQARKQIFKVIAVCAQDWSNTPGNTVHCCILKECELTLQIFNIEDWRSWSSSLS